MKIKSKIMNLINEFSKQHEGKRPTKLHLSTDDEFEILKLPATDIGSELASKITNEGREGLKKEEDGKYYFLGLEILRFNTEETSVSNCED